mmetsp:Transcript_2022/g.6706  ORF Transcript_2022/g.6706 Transcript_2022/m.6706 type:complete len:262 (-) Transcript_2022:191-976(-)
MKLEIAQGAHSRGGGASGRKHRGAAQSTPSGVTRVAAMANSLRKGRSTSAVPSSLTAVPFTTAAVATLRASSRGPGPWRPRARAPSPRNTSTRGLRTRTVVGTGEWSTTCTSTRAPRESVSSSTMGGRGSELLKSETGVSKGREKASTGGAEALACSSSRGLRGRSRAKTLSAATSPPQATDMLPPPPRSASAAATVYQSRTAALARARCGPAPPRISMASAVMEATRDAPFTSQAAWMAGRRTVAKDGSQGPTSKVATAA